jgi:hypothetical protein
VAKSVELLGGWNDPANGHEPRIFWRNGGLARARLAQNQRTSPRSALDLTYGLLRFGIARCALCGAALRPKHTKQRNRPTIKVNYVCPKGNRRNGCTGVSISLPVLDEAVWAYFANVFLDLDSVTAMVPGFEEASAAEQAQLDIALHRLAELDRQHTAANEELVFTTDANSKGKMRAHRDALAKEIESVQAEVLALGTRGGDRLAEREIVLQYAREFAEGFRDYLNAGTPASLDHRRTMLRTLDTLVLVWPEAMRTPRAVMLLKFGRATRFPLLSPDTPVELCTYPEGENSQSLVGTMYHGAHSALQRLMASS